MTALLIRRQKTKTPEPRLIRFLLSKKPQAFTACKAVTLDSQRLHPSCRAEFYLDFRIREDRLAVCLYFIAFCYKIEAYRKGIYLNNI
jgi:hypothetical protein